MAGRALKPLSVFAKKSTYFDNASGQPCRSDPQPGILGVGPLPCPHTPPLTASVTHGKVMVQDDLRSLPSSGTAVQVNLTWQITLCVCASILSSVK